MEKEVSYRTTCCYCGVGCGMQVRRDAWGALVSTGDPAHPVNRGMLCSKGMNLHYTAMDTSDRLLYPMERTADGLRRIGWEQAIGRAANGLREIIARYGPEAVGFYVSGQCLTEEYYLVNKLARGFIGTNHIDTNSRLCMSSAVSAYKLALGEDSVPGCYEDIELADTFLIAGANPAWCHPILYRRMEAHKAGNPQVKVIVVDPRKTQTAAQADLHLQITPGTDIVLYHAIARGLIENGFVDEAFIQGHTEGFEALREKVMQRTLPQAAALCGIRFTDIYRAVKYIGYSGGFMSMWAMGLNQSSMGVSKNLALINLSLITGKIGKPGCGPFSLTGQANAMGGREVGGMATLAPAHRDPGNPQHLAEVARYWGVPALPTHPGLTATEMFRALRDGHMKAIWIICTNPAVSLPDANLAGEALEAAELVIVQDMSSKSDTLAYADLVLPAATWLEKEGTMTNSERRIGHLSRVLDPPGEALPDAEILIRFAEAMGWGAHFRYHHPGEIYAEHAGLTRGTRLDISGLDYARLQEEGTFQWPVPERSAAGTPRLFTDHVFYRPGGRARIHAEDDANLSEPLSPAYPLILTTGRIRDQWHTMTRTGKVRNLGRHIPAPFLEIHPADAAARDIAQGDPVDVTNSRGQVRVTAVVTDTIKKGVVFLPMHWGKMMERTASRANNLTAMRVDRISRQPDFKYSAVNVCRYRKPPEKIVIWGEGEAVPAFLRRYRTLNRTDEICWVCGPDPVCQGEERWQELLLSPRSGKARKAEELVESLEVSLLRTDVERIDSERKVLMTAAGPVSYDRLILAGRSPRPAETDHEYWLPTPAAAAERLRPRLVPGSAWVLEGNHPSLVSLAAALAEKGLEVHLVPGDGRLPDLADETADRMVRGLLARAKVILHVNCRVQETAMHPAGREVLLGTGEKLLCAGVIRYRDPVPPDLPGVLSAVGASSVNGYMETAQPGVFSLDASFRSPEEGARQAVCLADYLHGNPLNPYQPGPPSRQLEIGGVPVRVLGTVRVPAGDPAYEEIVSVDTRRFYYKKCVVFQDRLEGVVFIGDDREYPEYSTLLREGTELGEKRGTLLRSGSGEGGVRGKLVCSCRQVGEDNIRDAIASGCRTVAEIGTKTGAGTRCGSCRPEIAALLAAPA